MLGTRTRLSVVAALAALVAGCGSDDDASPAAGCAADHMFAGACVGAPSGPLCADAVCAGGVACASTIEVDGPGALANALSGAKPGSCLLLHPGAYGDIVLPGSVSLLGKGAGFVHVDHVALGAGSGAVVRGITVGAGGIELDGATGIRIDATRIANAQAQGIRLANGASADIVSSEILDSSDYGVRAFDAAGLTIDRSLIERSSGPGVWVQCASGCDCASQPQIQFDHVIVRDSKVIGVSLVGASATMADVRIADNSVSTDFQPSGGMSVSGCAKLDAKRIDIANNSHYGLLVDHASATIGGAGATDGFLVDGNRFGIWLQNGAADQSVKLTNGVLTGNRGVGIGFSGSTHGIIINYFQIKKTQFEPMPVISAGKVAGSQYVCDAVSWQGGAQAAIDGLTLAGNDVPEQTPDPNLPPPKPRASLLIDGAVAAGSSLAHITLTDGDETKAFAEQSLPAGGVTPDIGEGVPMLTQSATELFAIPAAPVAPEAK